MRQRYPERGRQMRRLNPRPILRQSRRLVPAEPAPATLPQLPISPLHRRLKAHSPSGRLQATLPIRSNFYESTSGRIANLIAIRPGLYTECHC